MCCYIFIRCLSWYLAKFHFAFTRNITSLRPDQHRMDKPKAGPKSNTKNMNWIHNKNTNNKTLSICQACHITIFMLQFSCCTCSKKVLLCTQFTISEVFNQFRIGRSEGSDCEKLEILSKTLFEFEVTQDDGQELKN